MYCTLHVCTHTYEKTATHTHTHPIHTQWRGGGVTHGPKPRSHAHKLLKKVRRLGIKCALSAKAFERRLMVVDSLKPPEPKTVGCCGVVIVVLCAAGGGVGRGVLLDGCSADVCCVIHTHPRTLNTQKLMHSYLTNLLAEQPRMSVLLVDSDTSGPDGGYGSVLFCAVHLLFNHLSTTPQPHLNHTSTASQPHLKLPIWCTGTGHGVHHATSPTPHLYQQRASMCMTCCCGMWCS